MQLRLIGNPLGRNQRQCIPTRCLLLERDDGLTLVDTGIGREDLRTPRRQLGAAWVIASRPTLDPKASAHARVRELGFDPTDVRQIVFTHLDLDHAGGLADFPHATAHVLREELDVARSARPVPGFQRGRYRRRALRAHEFWCSYAGAGEPWMGIEGAHAVTGMDGEVVLVPLPGHSRGHAGVAIRQAEGDWLLHAGDAVMSLDQISDRNVRLPPGIFAFETAITVDRTAARSSIAHLRQLRAAGCTVLCAHDRRDAMPVTQAIASDDQGTPSSGACGSGDVDEDA